MMNAANAVHSNGDQEPISTNNKESHDLLLTPGPLTTSKLVREAMLSPAKLERCL